MTQSKMISKPTASDRLDVDELERFLAKFLGHADGLTSFAENVFVHYHLASTIGRATNKSFVLNSFAAAALKVAIYDRGRGHELETTPERTPTASAMIALKHRHTRVQDERWCPAPSV
jgi:hypothetical protein